MIEQAEGYLAARIAMMLFVISIQSEVCLQLDLALLAFPYICQSLMTHKSRYNLAKT